MESLIFTKGKVVQDLSYFKKEAMREVAKEQFKRLQRLGLIFPVISAR